MVESGSSLGFALETFKGLRIVFEFAGKEF
jgi:hypothetical protein